MIRALKMSTLALLATGLPAFAAPMTAVLSLKERVPLRALAEDVKALPQSAPRAFSVQQIRTISGPLPQQYQALINELRAAGFQVVRESPTGLWITVSGDSSVFEKVFQTKFSFATDGVHAPLVSGRIPTNLSLISNITGFDNRRHSHSYIRRAAGAIAQVGGISQAAIKTGYGFDAIYKAGISGKGQHIAIATYDGFKTEDVTQFYTASKLSPMPTVDQVNFNGTAAYKEDSAMETDLDAEFAGMIAPGAAVHVFTSSTNDDLGELQMFTAILDDNRAKVINYSWGDCEKHVAPAHKAEMDKVFARAVAQGVNIMVASGDSGSDSCQDGSVDADWPAASPDVVAVGGTTFKTNGGALAETAWSGSGGGISKLWQLPPWQSGLGSPYVNRSYPDVAFNADPASGQAIWTRQMGHAGWMVIGGTSMAAPQWAGFLALVGEARAAKGLGPVGDINPIIYRYSAQEMAATMNDVTAGSNGAYHAGPGYDAVTGHGSMKASALLSALISN